MHYDDFYQIILYYLYVMNKAKNKTFLIREYFVTSSPEEQVSTSISIV